MRDAFLSALRRLQRRGRRLAWIVAVFLGTFCASSPAFALDIRDVLWSFDGQTVPTRFNMLSILVDNTDRVPFEGTLRLRVAGVGLGEPIEEPVYLAPHTQRWVQFFPYVGSSGNKWMISWGRRRGEQVEIDEPHVTTAPQPVQFMEGNALVQSSKGIKQFPAALFPASVTGTDTLGKVVLDYAPRWEESRRTAFLDWLRRGGELHLLRGVQGKWPVFQPPLDVLNTPLDTQQIGAGTVHRHAKTSSEFDAGVLARRPVPPPQTTPFPQQNYNQAGVFDQNGTLCNLLKSMTQPEHAWWLLYGLSLVYILLIFPVCFQVGRRTRDYRLVFGVLLGTVLMFSVGFSWVGRRGYDETTALHSVAVAQQLKEGEFNLTQWSNVFVTAGAMYDLKHPGTGTLWSTAQEYESIRGVIANGTNGLFHVDIPAYSARPFMDRAKVQGDAFSIKVKTWDGSSSLQKLVLKLEGKFPEDVGQAFAYYRGGIYPVTRQKDEWHVLPYPQSPASWFQADTTAVTPRVVGFMTEPDSRSEQERFNAMFHALVRQNLEWPMAGNGATFPLPDSQIRLLFSAPMPKEFFAYNIHFGKQSGLVVYALDIPLKVTP